MVEKTASRNKLMKSVSIQVLDQLLLQLQMIFKTRK